ncbi:precorrin-6A reductase [Vallitalea sp.]|jgi:precorrin-6A/cobalt-precorrin-6A reductase|uniref:precorrin-6A reductase n=1 Tax=Vallitalea sp. TaxID=1882829 RepID=UPI0025F2578F|nr:precorrin-6A reductase [Vallitalea sp.]MCT4687764.1 precorrin-6A reductase [Vallitalea sp.]
MILILGGTSDSIIITNNIASFTKDIILSCATEYGKKVASKSYDGNIIYGKMNDIELGEYCIHKGISIVIDATHPYAKQVSENAIKACKAIDIEYVRYERPLIEKHEGKYIYCYSYEEAGKTIDRLQGNVLITTGSKDVEHIIHEIKDKNRAYIRVLPQSGNIEKLERLHVLPDQIIAMKGPFSKELNVAIMNSINCKIMVTKESGSRGMIQEKLQGADECNVKVIIIGRPKIDYPKVFFDMDHIIDYIKGKGTIE